MIRAANSWWFLAVVLALGCTGNRTAQNSGYDVVVKNAHGKLAGVGSRTLLSHLAATYFIRSADPKGDVVIDFVVFLKGAAGWTESKTDWTFDTSEPVAYSRYAISGNEFRVELDLATGTGRVLGRSIPTTTTNIVVVDGFGGPALTVSYSEHQDLRAPYSADPLEVFAMRSPALQRALDIVPLGGKAP